MFEELDQPALKPLPSVRTMYALRAKVRPHVETHVTIDKHHYSVPHQRFGKQLDARVTSVTAMVFHKGKRVASHARSPWKGGHSTIREHMPPGAPGAGWHDPGEPARVGRPDWTVHHRVRGRCQPLACASATSVPVLPHRPPACQDVR